MSLTDQDVEKIAHLARLEMGEQERSTYANSLSRILGLIEQMKAVETAGVEPMSHPFDVGLRLREDAATEVDARERFLRLAPATEAGLYLVPKVIE